MRWYPSTKRLGGQSHQAVRAARPCRRPVHFVFVDLPPGVPTGYDLRIMYG